jgi:DNA (cytosine-5)-methyltransferase 1
MKILDLFAGIGGFSLAGHWMGWETAAFVEWDQFCQKVLKKNFPDVPIFGDIRQFDGTKYRGTVDIVCGGFPCQPFSTAGKRKGKEDDRFLWPEMRRIIREVKPKFFVAENVYGLITQNNGSVLKTIISQMENEGYEIWAGIIPASAVEAQHRRNRIWIVGRLSNSSSIRPIRANQSKERHKCNGWWSTFGLVKPLHRVGCKFYLHDRTEISGTVDGVSSELDKNRIKALGNAIVPQVAYQLFKAIEAN